MQVVGGPAAAVRLGALVALAPKDIERGPTCSVWSFRRKTEEDRSETVLTDRPATSAWRVHPAGRKDLTPPGGCSDDGGRRPWASRRSCLGRGAPPVSALGRPSPVRGESGHG